ncbi:hypothetical protein BH09BAC1_BH09BAC1_17920 [soil metagenome]
MMRTEREGMTIMEQVHMAALLTDERNEACVIDYEDASGQQIIKGSVFYFTNSTVCLNDGRLISISDIRKITC